MSLRVDIEYKENADIKSKYKKLIDSEIKKTTKDLSHFLTIDNAHILIDDNKKKADAGDIGSSCLQNGLIKFHINKECDLEKAIDNKLSYMITHELAHTERHINVGAAKTLYEDILSEGLATNFERLKYKKGYRSMFEKDPKKIKQLIEFLPQRDTKKTIYDYNKWFWPQNETGLPDNIGYHIGNFLVAEYCKENKVKIWDILNLPFKDFRGFMNKHIK